MKLKEILDALSAGEFSQLAIGGAEQGEINASNYPRVLTHVNAALTALYTRFALKENSLKLQLIPGKTKYELHSSFAVNAKRSNEPQRYILDTPDEPFEDDILKVIKVTSNDGKTWKLNDHGDPDSVMTPSDTVLKVPLLVLAETMTISYRANHPVLAVGRGFFDPGRVDVELPRSHMEALLFYVASRVHNPIGMTNEFNAGNNYYMKYEAACQMLEGKGMQVDQGSSYDRVKANGWV